MKRRIALSLMLISLALLQAVPFMDGEKLNFHVKYGLIKAAEATLEAQTADYQGSAVWQLSTNAKTFPFFDKVFKVRDETGLNIIASLAADSYQPVNKKSPSHYRDEPKLAVPPRFSAMLSAYWALYNGRAFRRAYYRLAGSACGSGRIFVQEVLPGFHHPGSLSACLQYSFPSLPIK